MYTDTPETDAVVFSPHVYWPDFARRLELERDEARSANAELNQRLIERQESFQAQLIRIEDGWREKLREKDAQIVALREALEYALEPEYLQAINTSYMADDADRSVVYSAHEMFRKALSAPAPAVVPLEDVHLLLDGEPAMIVRNAKDGYPEGREDRFLSIEERIASLKQFAADYQRWLKELE